MFVMGEKMSRPLKIFMRGKSVALLQEALRRMGYDIHDQKALFGTDTREAVKSYQKQQGLQLTGVVDDALRRLMQGGALAVESDEIPVKEKINPVNQQELDTLIRLLISKGVINQKEWDDEKKKVVPSSLT